jgi:cholesterol oxidase
MSFWPNRGEEDPRPAMDQEYCAIAPVVPKNPMVPADAPAALKLPISPA